MKRSWWASFVFLIIMTVVSIVVVIPTLFNYDSNNSNYPVKSKINLGLDLQGGLYMILGIDFLKVYRDEVKGYARKIEYVLKDHDIQALAGDIDASTPDDPIYSVVLNNEADIENAKNEVRKFFQGVVRLVKEDKNTLWYGLGDGTKKNVEEQSVSKSIEVIRNRIDEFGVTEPEIVSQGKDRIVVALPGVKDIDRAKELIGKTAKLEFKIVNDQVPMATIASWLEKAKAANIVFKKGDSFSEYLNQLNSFLKADLPAGYEIAFERKLVKGSTDVESSIPYLVDVNPQITGDELQDASVQYDQQKAQPYVSLEFKASGAARFEEVTGDNVGKRMAVILDGNVYTAPNIQQKIGGGRAQITLGNGNYNDQMEQARDIALVLRAGALPVQLDFLEQRIVGPSLGSDSIIKAEYASVVATLLIFIFVLIYYRISGGIAAITLALNVLFVLAALVGLEATLTLPGIAGIALTVGMAVDGNIIIYERIREEIRAGASNFKSVEAGFSQAFWTIIDANVTTALAGIALLNFGTGPIKGFAVTLLIGIAATVYTAYFVSKLMFDFYMNKVDGQDLSI